MPTRTYAQYLGDVAEALVAIRLTRAGAVVNPLTRQDYGWDLHVQLPAGGKVPSDLHPNTREEPSAGTEIRKRLNEITWELSASHVVVQVKGVTAEGDYIRAKTTNSEVAISTLEAWCGANTA